MNQTIKHIICGIIIGTANIIPGVSGGTMALVLGFYEKLIAGINNISVNTIKIFLQALSFKKDNFEIFKQEFLKIEGPLLLKLGIGAIIAIISLAKLLSYLLIYQHNATYGFFFGLVLASIYSPYTLIKKKSGTVFISIIIAAIFVIAISNAMSGEKLIKKAELKQAVKQQKINSSEISALPKSQKNFFDFQNIDFVHLIYLFISGAIAISAMILPGISGSFVLLLMGAYFEILKAIAEFNLIILMVFSLGCLIGIILFTKLLNFLLNKFYDITMGFLTGLVLGSLWVIWPFKTQTQIGDEIIYLNNIIPSTITANEIITCLSFISGCAIVIIMIFLAPKEK